MSDQREDQEMMRSEEESLRDLLDDFEIQVQSIAFWLNKLTINQEQTTAPCINETTDLSAPYSNKKYHSGTMWWGVEYGFAGLRLTGWVEKDGVRMRMVNSKKPMVIQRAVSLIQWVGKNWVEHVIVFDGFEIWLPTVEWRKPIWMRIVEMNRIGKTMCREKYLWNASVWGPYDPKVKMM